MHVACCSRPSCAEEFQQLKQTLRVTSLVGWKRVASTFVSLVFLVCFLWLSPIAADRLARSEFLVVDGLFKFSHCLSTHGSLGGNTGPLDWGALLLPVGTTHLDPGQLALQASWLDGAAPVPTCH